MIPGCSAKRYPTHSDTNFCQPYASAYDAMYRDKDYEAECDFLVEVFQRFGCGTVHSILDLGCGTGGHAIPLTRRGYEVVGVDCSAQMIAIARAKSCAVENLPGPGFEVANIRDMHLGRAFDAAICMFAVLGYQTTNERLLATLHTVRRHLNTGGLFVCDFWYGPAVLTQRPGDRIKIATDGADRVVRLTKAALEASQNVVCVSFHILRLRDNQVIQEAEETHRVRYLFRPEVEFLMADAGLELLALCPVGKLEQHPSETAWSVSAIARAT
jgi:SAM-dependent methyltransferase